MTDDRRSLSRLADLFGGFTGEGPGSARQGTLETSTRMRGADEFASSWSSLRVMRLSGLQADRARLVGFDRTTPESMAIDMLRTRVVQVMTEQKWRRIAVTSPTKGCGKTFVAANLALSVAKRREKRVGLVDLDLRRPSIAKVFGVSDAGILGAFLEGLDPYQAHVRRLGSNLAVGLNGVPSEDPAEILQNLRTKVAFAQLEDALGLDIVIVDTPPMLACDDFMSIIPSVDCALLVACGGVSRASDVDRCVGLMEEKVPLLGVVLNQADDPSRDGYMY